MPRLTFFKNVRNDGGVRTGIAVDDETVLENFRGGQRDADPILVWYVDLQFKSARVPKDPEEIKEWLLRLSECVKDGLDEIASKMELGIDQDWNPFTYALTNSPPTVSITLTGAAMRRVRIDDFAKHLRDLKDHWEAELRRLKSPVPSTW